MRTALALLVTLLLATPATAGTLRLGIFVGNNVGLGDEVPLRHAEREAEELARLFRTLGGIERSRAEVLIGQTAPVLMDKLAVVEGRVQEGVDRGDDVMVVLYYSGHAGDDTLHMNGTELSLALLRTWLTRSPARVKVAFVDACESGAMARSKGGAPAAPLSVGVDEALTVTGTAVITSTGPTELARESDELGGGIFSRALITGLRGAADVDDDGRITLSEAYAYAFAETVRTSAAVGDAIQRPEHLFQLHGTGEVVLTRLADRAAVLVFAEEQEGTYSVISLGTGELVARVDKAPGEQRRLGLPAGRYVVRKVRRTDVLVGEVDLIWGGNRWLADTELASVPLGDALARGGWYGARHGLALQFAVQGPPIANGPVLIGGELAFHGRLSRHWLLSPRLSYGGGFHEVEGADVRLHQIGLDLLFVHLWQKAVADLTVGAGPCVAAHVQYVTWTGTTSGSEDEDGWSTPSLVEGSTTRAQIGPGVALTAGVQFPLGPAAAIDLGVVVRVLAVRIDSTTRFFPSPPATSESSGASDNPAHEPPRTNEPAPNPSPEPHRPGSARYSGRPTSSDASRRRPTRPSSWPDPVPPPIPRPDPHGPEQVDKLRTSLFP